ncbi:hypothetical protein Dsin_020495 [Dipteronia sinensis]|uniref:DUF4283 domain-containing protein n=1 Tax=Dipteronia sinensis TaxID=43782 RepID=A0AAE0AA42_9ROSI|nr:hypothetical protein Dsin_020495 [Dipteronia sinensis]
MIKDTVVSDAMWLDKSVVGVMKKFSNFTKVTERPISRGFSFRARFLGGRAILWSFRSSHECEGFIRNRFFWEDLFSSMEKWSMVRSYNEKPYWFNILGIPLNYWNEMFFQKLGSRLGDLLMIDIETFHRRRLDRARLLISVPMNRLCPKDIKVIVGNKTFPVMMGMDPLPVESKWLEDTLSLKTKLRSLAMKWLLRTKGYQTQNHVGEKEKAVLVNMSNPADNMGKKSVELCETNQTGKGNKDGDTLDSLDISFQEKTANKVVSLVMLSQ